MWSHHLHPVASGVVDRNMNLSIGVTPTYSSVGPVAGGVTMMTSKSESPISAQGSLALHGFQKDPPADIESDIKPENSGQNTPPTIQITNFDSDENQDSFLNVGNFAQVYQIPINQTYRGNFIMGEQQHMYGIILPQNEYLQPVTLVQDLSLQTTNTDRNFNNLVSHQNMLVQSDPYSNAMPFAHPMQQQQNIAMMVNGGIPSQSPPATQVLEMYNSVPNSVLNPVGANVVNNVSCDSVVVTPSPQLRSRNNSESNRVQILSHVPPPGIKPPGAEMEESER
ncbi:uncharacterized protein CEXT_702171 [Caerostris extrusa]|uniref:Uncharacterized protein n=1 Tax=Caerostris extrusa TaxID=172846 RepID=A0AAV4XTV3_CAEEX|nr:uncharacterized protein CEXT_702171 [Caerostris extrusa]